eukprot:gene2624-1041_t
MRGAGVQPTEVSYTTAITVCRRAGEFTLALGVVADMRDRGLEP